MQDAERPGFDWRVDVPVPNTLRLPARAGRELRLHTTEPEVLQCPAVRDWLADPSVEVLGGGSNLVFVDPEVPRAVRVTADAQWVEREADGEVDLVVEAGKGLDELVRETAAKGWYGLEALAEIPGTVGAAPLQNVGAYGTEIGERIRWVEALDREAGVVRRLTAEDCRFAYRTSRFKRERGHWLVTRVALRLRRQPPKGWPPADYPGVAEALEQWSRETGWSIDEITPLAYAEVITGIRRRKLPDWRAGLPGSVGSFFQNPVVSAARAAALIKDWPGMPQYPLSEGERVKLSAGWLIERCGFRGFREGAVGVSEAHALVLLHHGGGTGDAFRGLAQRIQSAVAARFGVELEPEPRLVTAE
ncbi:MAG: UDP-N-acetylmuramate dehydrogenase [Pseudomonadota bacterium]